MSILLLENKINKIALEQRSYQNNESFLKSSMCGCGCAATVRADNLEYFPDILGHECVFFVSSKNHKGKWGGGLNLLSFLTGIQPHQKHYIATRHGLQ